MEHTEWVGDLYEFGIKDKKVFIVGNSHYPSITGEKDRENLTVEVMHRQLTELQGFRFFNAIQKAFGYDRLFWHQVVFFNFQPEMVPTKAGKFAAGSPESNMRGCDRFTRLLSKHSPDKVLVFSNDKDKGWRAMPKTAEEIAGAQKLPLIDPSLPEHYEVGTYRYDGHTTQAFGLRHPNFDTEKTLPKAVSIILERYWA